MSTTSNQHRSNGSALKWLILVALAWSQLAFAAHQFDHQATDIGETCVVCVKFDRDDHVLIDTGVSVSVSPSATPDAGHSTSAAPIQACAHYAARASP